MIQVTVSGHVGSDSEIKNYGGTNVLTFSLASTKKVIKNGNPEQVTQWVNCSIWGERAEKLKPYILKGTSIVCVGEGEVRNYSKADGSAGASLNVRVNDFQFMGKPEQSQNNNPQQAPVKQQETNFSPDYELPF